MKDLQGLEEELQELEDLDQGVTGMRSRGLGGKSQG